MPRISDSIPAQPASSEISTSTMRSYNKSSLLPRNAFEKFGVLCGPIFIALISILSAYFMAITAYWLDRPHELTQDFDDFRFPGFVIQDFAYSYSVLLDRRPRSLCPRWLTYVNTCPTPFYWPAFGVIDGPVSYSDVGYKQVSLFMVPNLFTIRTNLSDGPLFAQQLLEWTHVLVKKILVRQTN